ncbi:MAG: Trk system potassium transporter TrkA [Clostridiales bacterium]|nr:Trk system potassium transporter TrkA [Clostridiales bacterium]
MNVIIIGAGKLGIKLAKLLVEEDIDVTVVDKDAQVLSNLNEHLDCLTAIGNGIDIKILKELGIAEYDLLVASTESDEANALICSLAKKLGCAKTIARIRNPEYMQQLDFIKAQMGIDLIINPDLATAMVIERYLLKSYGFYSDYFASGKVEMMDFNIHSNDDFVGKDIKDLKGFDDLLITAISRKGELIIPNGSTKLMRDDIIYIIGNCNEIRKISDSFGDGHRQKAVERVVILGGGNIGYYLADRLSKEGVLVTIIEKSNAVCKNLTEKLDNVLVIHGDGTDIHLLEEESLDEMDAFVGATGFDEENLLMALMAKQLGVGRAIAKISKANYEKIIDRLDIDVAINPVYITASDILKIVRGGKVISVSLLLGADAEVTEMVIEEDFPFMGEPLSSMRLPEGIIIGAIVRGEDVIIPKGDSIIVEGDRIVVFSLTEDLPSLKVFFQGKKGGILGELWNRVKGTR